MLITFISYGSTEYKIPLQKLIFKVQHLDNIFCSVMKAINIQFLTITKILKIWQAWSWFKFSYGNLLTCICDGTKLYLD